MNKTNILWMLLLAATAEYILMLFFRGKTDYFALAVALLAIYLKINTPNKILNEEF